MNNSAKVHTIALIGIDPKLIEVEVFISRGLTKFEIVGMAGKSVQEAKERVVGAIKNSGFDFPQRRIVINLAPADIAKHGAGYDMAIAVGILIASGQINQQSKSTYWGELSLHGQARSTKGAIAVAEATKVFGFNQIFLPRINAREAEIVAGINVRPVERLANIDDLGNGFDKVIPEYLSKDLREIDAGNYEQDFADIKGQFVMKRAVEIAAAGNHNILLSGPPGAGKTFIAKCMRSIMPDMTYEEKVEVSKIHSIVFNDQLNNGLISQRPFRSPHHTCSQVALIGGGSIPKPGEVTLAHRGVLFLDEFNEFSNKALETLRQPLEDKLVTISRAATSVTFPASFSLVAAMNPCKCGYLGDEDRKCNCSSYDLEKYAQKISGPILDRIDIQVSVPKVKFDELSKKSRGESSEQIRARVNKARKIQLNRGERFSRKCISNAELSSKQLLNELELDQESRQLIKKATETLSLSARGYFRILKVARTIADLESSEKVTAQHISEAISYRISCER